MENGIIFHNSILDVVFVAWFLAQFYKVVRSLVTEKKFILKRFVETGGMPSSHSSTVSALTTAVGIVYGTATPFFAISAVFAIIVMHDAAGIRRAAGKQAGVLNRLASSLSNIFDKRFDEEELKEYLGHSPVEVMVGCILGIVVAFAMKFHLMG